MKITESNARWLRSCVYGDCFDDGWEHVKETWMRPENFRWLEEQAKVPPFFAPLVYWKEAPMLQNPARGSR